MPCALCSLREGREAGSVTLCLLPADEDMGSILSALLEEHHIPVEICSGRFQLQAPAEAAVSLLRSVLSEPERQAVGVMENKAGNIPIPLPLDDWWRRSQTGWFAEARAAESFETWFQPIVDTSRHSLLGHECLVRLVDARRPEIPTRIRDGAEIVEAAKTRNELHAFDSFARRLAIRSAAAQPPGDSARFFVNFMPTAIYRPEHSLKSTAAAVTEAGLRPENFVFEAVNSDLVRDRAHFRRICDYLRAQGFGLALDNMGAGAATLQMVCDLQPDYIKLDRSLIANVEQPLYAATIRKLVELSGRFGIGVIAQGVENAEAMENLWLLGVQWMQGYFFGRPGPRVVRPASRSAQVIPVRPARIHEHNADSDLAGIDSVSEQLFGLDPDLMNLSQALAEACRVEAAQPAPPESAR